LPPASRHAAAAGRASAQRARVCRWHRTWPPAPAASVHCRSRGYAQSGFGERRLFFALEGGAPACTRHLVGQTKALAQMRVLESASARRQTRFPRRSKARKCLRAQPPPTMRNFSRRPHFRRALCRPRASTPFHAETTPIATKRSIDSQGDRGQNFCLPALQRLGQIDHVPRARLRRRLQPYGPH